MTTLGYIYSDITAERRRQDEKWGDQVHSPATWMAILAEEFGEAAGAMLEGKSSWREELIQVAAVVVAIVEAYDAGRFNK